MTNDIPNTMTADLTRTRRAEALMPIVGRLARTLARRVPRHVELAELVSAGNVGLSLALRRFESADSDWFDGYAIQRIRGAMIDALRTLDPLTRKQRSQVNRVTRSKLALTHTLGRKPEPHEVSAAAGLSTEEYWDTAVLADVCSAEHLDTTDASAATGEACEVPSAPGDSAEDYVIRAEQRDLAIASAEALPPRMQNVLTWYYRDDLTLREIGDRLGVTEGRVSQLRSEAITRLRAACGALENVIPMTAERSRRARGRAPEPATTRSTLRSAAARKPATIVPRRPRRGAASTASVPSSQRILALRAPLVPAHQAVA